MYVSKCCECERVPYLFLPFSVLHVFDVCGLLKVFGASLRHGGGGVRALPLRRRDDPRPRENVLFLHVCV